VFVNALIPLTHVAQVFSEQLSECCFFGVDIGSPVDPAPAAPAGLDIPCNRCPATAHARIIGAGQCRAARFRARSRIRTVTSALSPLAALPARSFLCGRARGFVLGGNAQLFSRGVRRCARFCTGCFDRGRVAVFPQSCPLVCSWPGFRVQGVARLWYRSIDRSGRSPIALAPSRSPADSFECVLEEFAARWCVESLDLWPWMLH